MPHKEEQFSIIVSSPFYAIKSTLIIYISKLSWYNRIPEKNDDFGLFNLICKRLHYRSALRNGDR